MLSPTQNQQGLWLYKTETHLFKIKGYPKKKVNLAIIFEGEMNKEIPGTDIYAAVDFEITFKNVEENDWLVDRVP